jgi:hypothetical protein
MTIKQNTPVAAAMGVFAFGQEHLPSISGDEAFEDLRAISLWVGMPRPAFTGAPNRRSRPRSISPASNPPLSLHAPKAAFETSQSKACFPL